MKRLISFCVGLLVFFAMVDRAEAQLPLELRPRLDSFKQCVVDPKGKQDCFEYFADEIELVMKNSIFRPLPHRVEDIEAIRFVMREGKAENYEFYSEELSRQLNLNLEMTQAMNQVGLDKIVHLRLKNINNETDLLRLLAVIAQDPNVEQISLSSIVKAFGHTTNDPLAEDQWYFKYAKFDQAQHLVGYGSPEIHTAFFDSGYDATHEDLPKPFVFFDHIKNIEDAPTDKFGHGTATAGVVMQIPNNGIGGIGVSPGVTLWIRKVLDSRGFGSWSVLSTAIVAQTAKCVEMKNDNPNIRCTFNFSLGGIGPIPSVDAALNMAYQEGIVAVAATGNGHYDLGLIKIYPAAKPGTIAVAALDAADKLMYFSGYGTDGMITAAPGIMILAPSIIPDEQTGKNYLFWNGTSLASPQVLGAVNLAWSAHRELTAEQIRILTISSSHTSPKLRLLIASGGRIDPVLMINLPPEEAIRTPYRLSINTSHIALKTTQAWREKIAGFVHYISEEPFDKNNLNRLNIRQIFTFDPSLQETNQGDTTVKLVGNLNEKTTYYLRLRSFNRVGNFSPLTDTIEFQTKKAEVFAARTFTTASGRPDAGQWFPERSQVTAFGVYGILPWHLTDIIPSASGQKQYYWRVGRVNELDYLIDSSDSMIKSEIFDLRGRNGASVSFDYLQKIQTMFTFFDKFSVYVIPLDESNGGIDREWDPDSWILLKEYNSLDNTPGLSFQEEHLDLSVVAGKRFRLVFRVLNLTGGQFGGFGWMFGNVKVHVDEGKQLY